jgi:NTP pyrophosphatase (non-canonical NTP hydrolase)
MTDFEHLMNKVAESTKVTFPHERSILALAKHLKKECDELIAAIGSNIDNDIQTELCDCLILILNIAITNKIESDDLTRLVLNKLDICEKRRYNTEDTDGIIEHER